MTAQSPGPGLRERKRERTRRTIARAALELFDRQGFQQTTIPQIAEAADVSPRTVSAYYPHKEDLAFPDAEESIEGFAARLRDRAPGETALDALRAAIALQLAEGEENVELQRMQRRVIDADETLLAYEQRWMVKAQEALAEAFAVDLGASPGDLEPRMAAAATVTIFVLLGEDLKRDDGPPDRTAALATIDRALLFIGAGVSALR
jgi:AcrR family transcriptional regulator